MCRRWPTRNRARSAIRRYQHPQRIREGTYNADVDRFPLLLIATALRCLMVSGRALWEKYDNGDNLLFKEADLKAPTKSLLFLDLLRSTDPATVSMVKHLLAALQGGLASVPLLENVLAELPVDALTLSLPAETTAARSTRPLQNAVAGAPVRPKTPVAIPLAAPIAATASSRSAAGTASGSDLFAFADDAKTAPDVRRPSASSRKGFGPVFYMAVGGVAVAVLFLLAGGAGLGIWALHGRGQAKADPGGSDDTKQAPMQPKSKDAARGQPVNEFPPALPPTVSSIWAAA